MGWSAQQEEGIGRSRLLGGGVHAGSKVLGRENAGGGSNGGDREVRNDSGVVAAVGVIVHIVVVLAIRARAMNGLRSHALECLHAWRDHAWKDHAWRSRSCGHCG